MKSFISLSAFLALIMTVSFAQNQNGFPVQTRIASGIIEGNYDTKTGVQKYFGIPFAKPPVGNLRWKAPQKVSPWQGVKQTKTFGPRPVQKLVFGDMNSRSAGVSEDCLYLNVWTPTTRSLKDLPVLVYFYGGGNVAGDGSEPRYDGEAMAQQGIVVVTCNYRLNLFGYLALPELSTESAYKASGNYGALDQVAALQWVKENIGFFGGDPSRVTIAGESAGSIGVSTHMASPLSKGLISGAIGESGAAIPPSMAPISLKEAEEAGTEFLKKFGIKNLAELRSKTTKELYEMYNESGRFGFPLVIDGYFLKQGLIDVFEAGEQAQVPLLAGWNSAEIPGAAFMYGMPYTEENFITRVNQTYPDQGNEVLGLYPHKSMADVEKSATDLASDRFIVYSTWKWLKLHSEHSNQAVYRYVYSKLRPELADKGLVSGLAGGTMRAADAPPPPKAIGAPHACEIEYAMGNLDRIKEYLWTAEDYQVSKTMMTYFANFIKTGNPNGTSVPAWEAVDKTAEYPAYQVIDVHSETLKSKIEERYLFHDKVYTAKK